MKKNKYRWREMKDEKPKIGEVIIVRMNDKTTPFIMKVKQLTPFGCKGDAEPFLCDVAVRFSDFLWRKMCKLPGEK